MQFNAIFALARYVGAYTQSTHTFPKPQQYAALLLVAPEDTMPSAILHPHLTAQLAEAVQQARHARHHESCDCSVYRSGDGEGWCSPQEWRFSTMADRILVQIARLSAAKSGFDQLE